MKMKPKKKHKYFAKRFFTKLTSSGNFYGFYIVGFLESLPFYMHSPYYYDNKSKEPRLSESYFSLNVFSKEFLKIGFTNYINSHFPIVNFPWLSVDVPRLPSYGI